MKYQVTIKSSHGIVFNLFNKNEEDIAETIQDWIEKYPDFEISEINVKPM